MNQFCNRSILILFYRLPVVALCALIFWQSSYPGVISEPLFPHDDKIQHFGIYALLAILSARALKAEKPLWSLLKIRIAVITFAFVFGLSDEIHQAFVPQRYASIYDLIADCAGSFAGCFLYLNFIPWKK